MTGRSSPAAAPAERVRPALDRAGAAGGGRAPGRARHAGRPGPVWRTARGPIPLDRPVLVGILNVTPDSFSDGGRFTGADAALAHAESLLADGATIVDVGGESTRPGRTERGPAEEELRRVVPGDRGAGASPSRSARLGRHGEGGRGAGGARRRRRDRERRHRVPARSRDGRRRRRHAGPGVILMHSRGGLLEIASYEHAEYGGDVVGGVLAELREALAAATAAGVGAGRDRGRPRVRVLQDGGAERRAVRPAARAPGARPARCWSGPRASGSSARSPACRSRSATARPPRPARSPGSGARGCSGCTPCAAAREALALAPRARYRRPPMSASRTSDRRTAPRSRSAPWSWRSTCSPSRRR